MDQQQPLICYSDKVAKFYAEHNGAESLNNVAKFEVDQNRLISFKEKKIIKSHTVTNYKSDFYTKDSTSMCRMLYVT